MGQSLVPAQGWCAARSWSVISLQLYQALPSEVLCRGPRPMSIQDNTLVRTLRGDSTHSVALLSLGLDALWNIL